MSKKSAEHTSARTSAPARRKRRLEGDIFARVREMQPVAKKIIADGFDDDRVEFSEDIPVMEPAFSDMSDGDVDELVQWSKAVYAVGIAVGLLLRPEAFDKGGAK